MRSDTHHVINDNHNQQRKQYQNGRNAKKSYKLLVYTTARQIAADAIGVGITSCLNENKRILSYNSIDITKQSICFNTLAKSNKILRQKGDRPLTRGCGTCKKHYIHASKELRQLTDDQILNSPLWRVNKLRCYEKIASLTYSILETNIRGRGYSYERLLPKIRGMMRLDQGALKLSEQELNTAASWALTNILHSARIMYLKFSNGKWGRLLGGQRTRYLALTDDCIEPISGLMLSVERFYRRKKLVLTTNKTKLLKLWYDLQEPLSDHLRLNFSQKRVSLRRAISSFVYILLKSGILVDIKKNKTDRMVMNIKKTIGKYGRSTPHECDRSSSIIIENTHKTGLKRIIGEITDIFRVNNRRVTPPSGAPPPVFD